MTEMQIAYRNLQETRRHNKASEAAEAAKIRETYRSNVAREQETYRSNLAQETLKAEANVINRSYYQQLTAETHRSNLAKEQQARQDLAEQARSNVARETETTRSNIARENENVRHNLTTESQSSSQLQSDNKLKAEQLKGLKIENKYREAEKIVSMGKDVTQASASVINSFGNLLRGVGQVINMVK